LNRQGAKIAKVGERKRGEQQDPAYLLSLPLSSLLFPSLPTSALLASWRFERIFQEFPC